MQACELPRRAARLPAVRQFAVEYCNLFDGKGNRPDQSGDRGPEYRNVVGIPGGSKSPLAKALVEASIKAGDKLDFASGKGDDPDARALSFVMDSVAFPFYIAEPYHQFHDGFNCAERGSPAPYLAPRWTPHAAHADASWRREYVKAAPFDSLGTPPLLY